MSLEIATYISELVSTNPLSGDQVSQGDDHLRLIKAVLQATFPNLSGAVTLTHAEINALETRVDTLEGLTATSPTFTGGTFTITLSDNGAAAGSTLNLKRISISPVASDELSVINFIGRDSGGGDDVYSSITATLVDPTSTLEDGKLTVRNLIAGVSTIDMVIGNGIGVGPTHAPIGNGTINALGVYRQAVELLPLTQANINSVYGGQVWSAGVQGAGTAMDSDLLDGQQGAYYADIPSRLGFTPAFSPSMGLGWGLGFGSSTTLPAGGTWAWFFFDTSTPNPQSGVSAGSTFLSFGASGYFLIWRVA